MVRSRVLHMLLRNHSKPDNWFFLFQVSDAHRELAGWTGTREAGTVSAPLALTYSSKHQHEQELVQQPLVLRYQLRTNSKGCVCMHEHRKWQLTVFTLLWDAAIQGIGFRVRTKLECHLLLYAAAIWDTLLNLSQLRFVLCKMETTVLSIFSKVVHN